MKVIIKNFLCYVSEVFEFTDNSLILIKGTSGRGKTTIFQAISWCLYKRVSDVHPRSNEHAKTLVELHLYESTIIISRQRNPGMLTVQFTAPYGSYLPSKYLDAAAQSIIDQLFGDYDVWLASCYIEQDSRNSFLVSNNAGKMDLLNKLAFNGEDPSVYISKLDEKINMETKTYKKECETLAVDVEKFNLESKDIDFQKIMAPDDIEKLQAYIANLKDQKSSLQKVNIDRDSQLQSLQVVNDQLNTVEQKIDGLQRLQPEIPQFLQSLNHELLTLDNLPLLSSLIKLRSEEVSLSNDIDLINSQICQLQRQVKDGPGQPIHSSREYTSDEIFNQRTVQDNYNYGISVTEKWGVPYSENDITQEITRTESILEEYTMMQQQLQQQKQIKDEIIKHQAVVEKLQRSYLQDREFPLPVAPKEVEPLESVDTLQEESRLKELQEKDSQLSVYLNSLAEYVELYNQGVELNEKIMDLNDNLTNLTNLTNANANANANANEERFEVPVEPEPVDSKLANIKEQITTLNSSLEKVQEEMNIMESEYQCMLRSKDVIDCPNCSQGLKYVAGKLVISKEHSITAEQINSFENLRRDKKQEANDISLQITQLKDEIRRTEARAAMEMKAYVQQVHAVQLREQQWEQERKMKIEKIKLEVEGHKKERSVCSERIEVLNISIAIDQVGDEYQKSMESYNEVSNNLESLFAVKKDREHAVQVYNKAIQDHSRAMQQYHQTCNRIQREEVEHKRLQDSHRQKIESTLQQIQSLQNLLSNLPDKSDQSDNSETRNLDVTNLDTCKINGFKLKITDLRKIAVFEVGDITVQQMETSNKLFKLQQQLGNLQEKLVELFSAIDGHSLVKYYTQLTNSVSTHCNELIEDIEVYINQEKVYQSQRTTLETMRNEIQEKYRHLQSLLPPSVDEELSDLEFSITYEQARLDESVRTNDMYTVYSDINQRNSSLTQKRDRLVMLNTLKSCSIEVECSLLQSTVDRINATISSVISKLFTDPISVTLNLYKVDKKKEESKQQVNFTINYKGGEFANYNRMSGGEKTRVSLALTMAMNQMSGCPFLMLDEVFGGLENDTDIKEIALEAIREHTNSRTVLSIGHEVVGGFYDDTVDLI